MRLEDWRQEGVGSISVAQGRKVGPSPESICRTPYHDYKREHSMTQWREGFKLWEEGTGDTLMQTGAGKWLVGNLLGDGDILKGCLRARVERQASSKLEWQVWMWGTHSNNVSFYGTDSNRALLFPYSFTLSEHTIPHTKVSRVRCQQYGVENEDILCLCSILPGTKWKSSMNSLFQRSKRTE